MKDQASGVTGVSEFPAFSEAVRARFEEMKTGPIFVVSATPDELWDLYLASFPPGTNPIFRQRTEHDCSCCRHFVKRVGGAVAFMNGALVTVWDHNALPEPYQTVANAMADHVRSLPIADLFVTKEIQYGIESNVEVSPAGETIKWNHFSAKIDGRHLHPAPEQMRGEARTDAQVFRRALEEATQEAVETVVYLISSNSIYRGEEFKGMVTRFREAKHRFDACETEREIEALIWQQDLRIAKFRNSSIGALVSDLSTGVDVETAVRAYEAKVAPENYKRPTAIITQRMVDDAAKTLSDLGLETAVERRFARLEDVSVDSVLFVDGAVQGRMKGGIAGILAQDVAESAPDVSKARKITLADFLSDVLPKVNEVSVLLENRHLSNFVSLTAPVHENTGRLFRWGNDFAWSYDGDVADSIKEKVKRAGGTVEGVALRASLAWFNKDDLDLHAKTPAGDHIYFGRRAGILDVDMNASTGSATTDPVENMRWPKLTRPGVYDFWVNQFKRRESQNVGFVVEIEHDDGILALSYDRRVSGDVPVARVTVDKNGNVSKISTSPLVTSGHAPVEKWGVRTGEFVPVDSIVESPNYWGDAATGNRHLFFMLRGCVNPNPARGIYNEFLAPGLEKHRKVFEVLGSRTKCPPTEDQISGVGFSSTRSDRVTVLVKGPQTRAVYEININ